MTTPSGTFASDVVNLTLRNTRKVLADNLSTHSVVLSSIKSAGGYETKEGGHEIQEPLMYGSNTTVKSYSGYEPFDLEPQVGTDSATYSWKQVGGSVSISGIEAFQNSGKAQLLSLLKARMEQLKITFYENIDDQLVSDGTGNGGKDLGGLALLVEEGGATSTVGNIDSSTYSWWANQSTDFDATYSSATFGTTNAGQSDTNGINAFRAMHYLCTRKSQMPNLILTTADVRADFEAGSETHRRTQSLEAAEMGFEDNVRFKGIPVVWDANVPAGTAWFLNTQFLRFIVGKGHEFKMSGFEAPIDQDAKVAKIHLYAALTTNRRSAQGVIYDIGV